MLICKMEESAVVLIGIGISRLKVKEREAVAELSKNYLIQNETLLDFMLALVVWQMLGESVFRWA